MLVADGVDGESLLAIHAALMDAGAVPRLVGARLGDYTAANGETITADASMENSPSVLFDGLVLPDGAAGVKALGADEHTAEFIATQYRHGKTILALGAASALLTKAGLPTKGRRREGDGGLLILDGAKDANAAEQFVAALAKHRHPARETLPAHAGRSFGR